MTCLSRDTPQLVLRRDVDQLVVRQAPPEEEREPRGELEIAQAIGGGARGAGRLALDAQQELGRRQQCLDRPFDARLEVAGRASFLVDRDQRLDVGIGHRAAIRALRERAEDLSRTGLFLARGRRMAGEDALAARRRLRRLPVERPGDVEHVDAGPVGVVAAKRAAAPRRLLGRRRGIGEAGRDQPRPRLDRQPDFQRAVGVHAVVVQDLAVLVVFGHGDEHAGIRPFVLAADLELLDELVIDAQLDVVLVFVDPLDGADGAIPLHLDAELVLAVERKRVPDAEAAIGRKRHVLVGAQGAALEPDLVDLGDGTDLRTADRGPADLGRRGDVARHQRRGDRQHVGVVVEAKAGHVARQQFGAVHFEAEEVVDRVRRTRRGSGGATRRGPGWAARRRGDPALPRVPR